MLSYIVRRILATIPVVLMVALFVFSLLYIAPGDPAAIIAGDQATPADVERIRASLGLDRPFLVRFFDWFWHVLQGDLGTSIFTNLPVSHMIAQRIEPTLSLMVLTLILSLSTRHSDGGDRGVEARDLDRPGGDGDWRCWGSRRRFSSSAMCWPMCSRCGWTGCRCRDSPRSSQGLWPFLRNLILPSVALGLIYMALIARITRATMLDVLSQDYVRTAKAKGVGQRGVLFVHALKNAAVPIVTVIGIGFAALIGGAVVTESVFAIPGLGRLTVDAILRRDYPVIQGVVLLFSFVYVLINLGVDLLYTLFDPRIRY